VATVVVVDSPSDLRLAETVLRQRGHRVVTACDGLQGLALVRRVRPDLLISDVLLPSMDGYQLVRELRRDTSVRETRVIFTTTRWLVGEVRRLGLACGVRHVLTKPWEPPQLVAIVDEALAAAPAGTLASADIEGQRTHADHLRFLSARLYEKVAELEHASEERVRLEERLRELVERLIGAHEEERRSIAADIHDDTVQVMAAVAMRVERLRLRTTDEGQLRLIDDIADTVREAAGRLRSLVFDLRPPALDLEGGLAGSIRVYLAEMAARSGLEFTVSGGAGGLDADLRLVLYRISQEALINVTKHAAAAHVDVRVEDLDAGVRVSIADDGAGFDASTMESVPGHLGVTAMRERAERAGGWWRCQSAPGSGTMVEFWVPR
jgi:signal transduction histidine kinase